MKLLTKIKNLKNSKVKKLVDRRIKEFETLEKKSSKEIFKELCFCILTANCAAETCINIHNKIDNKFLTLNKSKLKKKLKKLGYRFHNRAPWIIEARKYKDSLKKILKSMNESKARDWLVKNIKGIGYKEASHFLRNIGYKNLAIIDFHVIDLLVNNKIIKNPKTMTKRIYLEIENKLKNISKKLNLNLAELDLYLWYLETGKVLK